MLGDIKWWWTFLWKYIWEVESNEAALDVCQVILNPNHPTISPPSQPNIHARQTQIPELAPPLQPKPPLKMLPPEAPHQWPSGEAIGFKTAPDQWKFKSRTKNYLPITTVTSHCWTVLEQAKMTHNMWSHAKNCPQDCTTVLRLKH